MNTYRTQIHARCPVNPAVWDYYLVTIRSTETIWCEQINAACDTVRGITASQEDITKKLQELLPGVVMLCGRHGAVDTETG